MHHQTAATSVLLLDGDVGFLRATADALVRRGFAVRAASDDYVALLMLRRQPTDVAVVGHDPTGLEGERMVNAIRSRWPAVPVITLSANGTATSGKRGCGI